MTGGNHIGHCSYRDTDPGTPTITIKPITTKCRTS